MLPTTITTTDVIAAIIDGKLDDNLDGITAACRERSKAKAKAVAIAVKPGDKVRLANLRPKYMVGAVAIVQPPTGRRTTRIDVKIDADWLRDHPEAWGRFGQPDNPFPQSIGITADMIGEVLP